MLFTDKNVDSLFAKVMLMTLLCTALPIYALQNQSNIEQVDLLASMQQYKRQLELDSMNREELRVKSSSRSIGVVAVGNYDQFVITITNQQGFRKQLTNTYGSIDVSDLQLPYDGTFNYEILATNATDEVKRDILNNGRGPDASTNITVSKRVSGYFTTSKGSILAPEVLNEEQAKLVTLPHNSVSKNTAKFPSEPVGQPTKNPFLGEQK